MFDKKRKHPWKRINKIQKPEICCTQFYKVFHLDLQWLFSAASPYLISPVLQALWTSPLIRLCPIAATSPQTIFLFILCTAKKTIKALYLIFSVLPFFPSYFAFATLIAWLYAKGCQVSQTCPFSVVVIVAK